MWSNFDEELFIWRVNYIGGGGGGGGIISITNLSMPIGFMYDMDLWDQGNYWYRIIIISGGYLPSN